MDERTDVRTGKVLSPVHTVTVRAERDIRAVEGTQETKKRVRCRRIGHRGESWRTFPERFETRRLSPDERKRERETNERNERAKQTRRPDEASTIWEMKCRGIGKV